MTGVQPASDNHRGILYMVAACTGFIINDTFVKLASEDLSVAQVIILRSLIAAPVIALIGWRQGAFRSLSLFANRPLQLRTIGEVGASALYLTALAHMAIANATAIAQLVPLAVTAAAALVLGERVGVRRWTAITIGLLAVLLVIRPGMQGFTGWSLLALASVLFVVLRDLSSRMMPLAIHPLAVSTASLASLIGLGTAMLPLEPAGAITMRALLLCAGAAAALSVAYVLITLAMRHGEISVVAPFRYTILLWAIAIQVVIFGVLPDRLTLVGSAILVATGIYAVYRENKVRRDALALAAAAAQPPT